MIQRQRNRRSRANGFTLVEILIVVIILGILAAIVVPQFTSAAADTRRAALADTARAVRQAFTLYEVQHGGLPPDILDDGWSQLTTATDATGNPAGTAPGSPSYGPYLQAAPFNPFTNSSDLDTNVAGGAAWGFDSTTNQVTANDGGGHPFGGS